MTTNHATSAALYVAAGFASVAGHYATTIALVEGFAALPLAASAAGFLVGAAIKYLLNYFLAFRSSQRHSRAMVRFVITLGVLFGLNALLFELLHAYAGLHYMAAQVLTTGLLLPPGYLLSRAWVFGPARPC